LNSLQRERMVLKVHSFMHVADVQPARGELEHETERYRHAD